MIEAAEKDLALLRELACSMRDRLKGCTHNRRALVAVTEMEEAASLLGDDIRDLQARLYNKQQQQQQQAASKKQKTDSVM